MIQLVERSFIILFLWFLLYLCVFFLFSCAQIPVRQEVKLSEVYRHDMELSITATLKGKNIGRWYTEDGVMTVPYADEYRIEIETIGKMDLLLIESCHRHIPIERRSDSYSFIYEPIKGLEDKPGCPIHFASLEEGKGRIAWGFLDFGQGEGLEMKFACNGNEGVWRGIGVCQSEAGLLQEFIFQEPVVSASRPLGCELDKSDDNKVFRTKIPYRECVHAFESLSSDKKFRLTTIGYKEVLIRKD